MFDPSRMHAGSSAHHPEAPASRRRRASRPYLERLDARTLPATLLPVPNVQIPQFLGLQVPLEGGSGNPQTFAVTSDNPNIKATVAQGQFLTIDVTHASSGANDPAFTGTLVFQLFDDLTPVATSRIETLVNQGFYNGKNFHRIAANFPGPNDFIVQGGSVNGNGTGEVNQPGFPFADEFVQQLAFTGAGQLAMANAGDDTNSSQFFVTTSSPRSLDYQHTIFGQLVAGQQTLQQMTRVAKQADGTTPVTPILMSNVALSNSSPDGVIYVDATAAPAGQSANITVTATDPADGSSVSRTFRASTVANTQNERPFLNPVSNQVVGRNQPDIFQLTATDPNGPIPGETLTYQVAGGKTTNAVTGVSSFTPVQNATASVDANGVVTVTPNQGFTGVINLLVGVRNQVVHSPAPNNTLDSPENFDTQAITLTVTNGQEVNLAPIALPGTTAAVADAPNPVQLRGLTANPNSSQTLSFEILSGPTNGAISGFDPATGRFAYTPRSGFLGNDTVTFRVTDVGAPTPNLTSGTATQTITVGPATTEAVRLIGRVLVVTPPPRTDSVPNTVNVTTAGANVQVTVNGLLDAIQPAQADLDKIVVFGSKASDVIQVDRSVTVPTTLDGGHGGTNVIRAGGTMMRGHVWFGRNRITGSPERDAIIGRKGRFRARPSGGGDRVYAAGPLRRRSTLHKQGDTPQGQNFRLVNGRLIPIPAGRARRLQQELPTDDGTA